MKLLIDMNLTPRWTAFLEGHGIVAVHWTQIGNPEARDHEIIVYAASNGFAILTQDLDFGAILAVSNEIAPSVIQIRNEWPVPDVSGDLVLRALAELSIDIATGALITVDAGRVRVSVLPLRRV
jgi:predicted nuclease of predicted toxin-antitoxin system